MGKRAQNEGSIFQRADGRWCAQVSVWSTDGSRKLVSRYAATQDEARRLLTGLKSMQDAQRLVVSSKNATVRAWLDIWLEAFIKPNRAPRTYQSYYRLLKLHIPDRLGALPITKLKPEMLQRHFVSIAAAGLAAISHTTSRSCYSGYLLMNSGAIFRRPFSRFGRRAPIAALRLHLVPSIRRPDPFLTKAPPAIVLSPFSNPASPTRLLSSAA